MSFLSKQRVRQRMNNRMVPSLSSPSSPSTPLSKSSIEESLQNWTGGESSCPTLASLLKSCRCCNKSHCENLNVFVYAIRKLEDDARLAAEIGQGLLKKHEQYVTDSNEVKLKLEKQLSQSRQKILELEQFIEHENDRLTWEWQKTQKVCEESNRSQQLMNELDIKSKEIEKLRTFKSIARQSEMREENLRLSLEEVKQELDALKKSKSSLDSKFKKLKSKYDVTCIEKLKKDYEFEKAENEKKMSEIKESNENLRKTINKQLASTLLFDNNSIPPIIESNDQLVDLIKDLVSANSKLKTDLKQSQNENINLLAKKFDDDDTMTEQNVCLEESSNTEPNATDSSVIIFHSPPVEVISEPTISPYRQLYLQICLLQDRLQQTDVRALNRQLRRVFDIADLSNRSNSIIENIVSTEVDCLSENTFSTEEDFLCLIQMVQSMLKEIAQLRVNINDLQAEYVKRVEENGARVEQELQRRQEQPESHNVLSWLSTLFYFPSRKYNNGRRSSTHTLNDTSMLIPSKMSTSSAEDYSSSSHPTFQKFSLDAPQCETTVQKSNSIRKKRSSITISSEDVSDCFGNKITQ